MKKFLSVLVLTLCLTLALGALCFAKPLLVEDYNIFAKNELVVVIPADNPGGINDFADLGKRGIRLSMGNPRSVPAGNYAVNVLKNLQKINPGLKKAIDSNLISRDANVRAVLDKVATKEVDAGFVYLSDAKVAGNKVKLITIPKNIQVTDVFYPLAPLKESRNPQLAKEFIKYVNSKQGQNTLVQYGFKAAKKNPFTYKKASTTFSKKELTVYAAASLKNAFTEIGKDMEKMYGVQINFQFESSGALKTKIQNGAPVDVFASADMKNMLDLAK